MEQHRAHLLQLVHERMRQGQQASSGKPQATTPPQGPPPPGYPQFGPAADLPKMPFDPDRPAGEGQPGMPPVPQSQVKLEPKEALPGKSDEAGGRVPMVKTQRQVMSSEDEKQDTEDENISDLLGIPL